MSLTIVEQIAQVIYDRLTQLLQFGNENTEVSEVIRPRTIGTYTPKDLQVVLTQGETTENPELACPGNPPATCFVTTFNIRCHVMPDETSNTPKATHINEMAADVRKAICDPQNTWHNFDGLAIDATFETTETINSEAFDGVNIPLLVSYRTDENNPYNLRA